MYFQTFTYKGFDIFNTFRVLFITAITFTEGENQTATIGSSKRIQCRAENGKGTGGLTIKKQGADTMQFTCSVIGTTNQTCGDTDIVLVGILSGDAMSATLVIPDIGCSDKGMYECTPVTDMSQKAIMELTLTSLYT